jgi:ribosomal protein L11 methyltransferase
MMAGMLLRVSVTTAVEAEEAVCALFDDIFQQPASVYQDAESGDVTASVYLSRASDWSAARRARLLAGLKFIGQSGLRLGPGKVRAGRIRREDWAESWKRHFKPIRVGSSLLVKPSWSKRLPQRGQQVVVIDPGLSFGTGQHPTTRFCLEQIVATRKESAAQSFLDIGTGSGILAIAAARLRYSPVEGFDSDPDAIRIARTNARKNGVSRRVSLDCRDLTRLPLTGPSQFDVVCANLTDDLLLAERRRILNRLRPGGRLVLAGILRSQFQAVRRAYEAIGLKLAVYQPEGDWASGSFVRICACAQSG